MKWIIAFLLLSHSVIAQRGIDTTNLTLKQFAYNIIGKEKDNYKKAEKTLYWLSNNFNWLATDYKQRTVKEILARGGGNCYELSIVYMALIKELNIQYRPIAEINLHKETLARQKDAEELMSKRGNRASVFGFNHNDHRWIEVYDKKSNSWIPVDPTMGLIGYENWVKGRAWYGERKIINKELAADMIVPIAIFVVGKDGKMEENRTKHYVVDGLDKVYGGRLSKAKEWKNWVDKIMKISLICKEAFGGQVNLHKHQDEIKELGEIYKKMKLVVAAYKLQPN